MEDLEKFDLDSQKKEKLSQIDESRMSKTKKRHLPKVLLCILVIIILLGLISFFAVFLPAKKTYTQAMVTYQQAKVAFAAVKKEDISQASIELAKTKQDLTDTQTDLHALSFMQYVPIASGYYNDANHMINAGFHGLNATTILIDAIKPYTDVLGLKGQGSFSGGSAEQRIQTAVLTMGKITPQIDSIANSLVLARKELDMVNPNHYPNIIAGGKIQTQLKTVQNLADQGIAFVDQSRPLIKILPSLLGSDGKKKYLVLFQNDKELRPTGGFITAYAIFQVDKGVIQVETSSDIYELDNTVKNPPPAPAPIVKYLPKVYNFNIRDSNLSPDYISSIDTFRKLYKNSAGDQDINGIIALDTNVLVSTIKILGDEVDAGGLQFNTQIDKRCNCPQVIYTLEDNISRPVNYIKTERKSLLGQLLYAILRKALQSSPKLYWGLLLQNMLTEISQKHVLIDVFNSDAQSGVEGLNAAGRILPFEGDYLHINDANFAGAKANLYVTEAVEQNYSVDPSGGVTKTVTITYKNPFPPSDCDLEHGSLCLNATLRDWIRVYVPKGATLISSVGSQVKMTTYEELGKTVFEGFLTVNPLGSSTLVLKYKLPFSITNKSDLPVLIQKQPGTDNNFYTIKINGAQTDSFPLLTDKELKLKL